MNADAIEIRESTLIEPGTVYVLNLDALGIDEEGWIIVAHPDDAPALQQFLDRRDEAMRMFAKMMNLAPAALSARKEHE